MRRLLAIGVLATISANGMAGPYATEWTQLANYARLVQQLYQQAQMLKVQIAQFKHLSTQGVLFNAMQLGTLANSMVMLGRNVKQGMGLSYTMSNLDQIFRTAFPGYATNGVAYDTQYRNWSKADLDTMAGILSSIGAHTQDMNNDRMIFSFVENHARSAVGQNQILQAGLEMSDAQTQQLMKLRQLMQLQVTAMVTAEGHRVQENSATQQITSKAFGPGVFTHN